MNLDTYLSEFDSVEKIDKDYMEDMFGDKGVLYNVHYPINPEDMKEKGCDYVAALRKVNQSYEY